MYAFCDCSRLTDVTFLSRKSFLDHSVFENCVTLRRVTLPKYLYRIRQYTFRNCRSLTSVIIPDGVSQIDHNAFAGCVSLRDVRLPDYVSVDKDAFADTPFGQREAARLAAMNPVRAMSAEEAGLEIRNNEILSYTGNAEVLDFYKNVNAFFRKIGYRAFYRCESLRVIILPATCSWIDAQAFFGCPNLERVDIGNRSVMFGDEAFAGCGKLTEVIMERDLGKIYPHNVFAGTPFERKRRDSLTLGDNSGT